MSEFGFYIIPIILVIIVFVALYKGVPVFDTFLEGALEGLKSTFSISASLIGLITAVSMLKNSGALDIISNILSPPANILHFPAEILPLAILRPVSGSGSIALLDNILKNYGAESFIGKLGSMIMGSTETTFYTIAVYFGSVKIKNSRHTIPCALLADITAFICSLFIANFLMVN
ncbi:MAG: spore maturation protein [Acutalibacteraceae bacterium]